MGISYEIDASGIVGYCLFTKIRRICIYIFTLLKPSIEVSNLLESLFLVNN